MKRAGIRLFLAACAVLLMGAGILRVRDTAAQENDWSVDLIAYYCPSSHTAAGGYDDCTTPASGIEIIYHPADVNSGYVTIVTGESGGGGVVDLPGASIGGGFRVTIPDGIAGVDAVCVNPAQEPLDVFVIDNSFHLPPITAGDTIGCSVYLVAIPQEVDAYGLGAVVTQCTQGLEGTVWWVAEFCSAPEGVGISFADASGTTLLDCVAENPNPDPKGASCSLEIPYGSDPVTVTLDTSTIPDGYELVGQNPQTWDIPTEPPTGLLGGPFFLLLPVGSDVPDNLDEQAQATEPAENQAPQVEGRTVVLYSGDCDNLGEEIATLNDVLPEDGDKVGDEKAIPAEMSITTGGAFFLDAAIDEGAALVVYEDDTTDTPVACGDLGGANTHDGMLPIGLGEVDDSGIVGTAVLSYNTDNDTTTDVTIIISAYLLPEPTGTPAA